MPRIKRELINKSQTYLELNRRSDEIKEQNDCTVKAISIVCGISYDQARIECSKHGRRDRRGMSRLELYKLVERMGFKWERVLPNDFIARYPSPHCNVLKNVTTHHMDRFKNAWVDGHTYMVHTRNHVLAVVNGTNHDWTRGSAKRVEYITRITKKEK